MPFPRATLFVPLACLCMVFGVARAGSIHMIPRADAQALVPVIRPLLGDDGYVNAYQGKLIIRTSDARFERIQKMLGKFSSATKTVTIYLRRSGHFEGDDSGVRVGDGGVTVTEGARRHDGRQVYSVSTLSGSPVDISRGSLVAVAGSEYPALVSLRQGIVAKPVVTGDGRVRLKIRQSHDRREGHGRFSTQGAATTLLLAPGQWQPVGSIRESSQGSRAGIGGVSSSHHRTSLPLEVKVEVK